MRNAEFDRETVLRSAMVAFMTKGYAKTSMQDLTKATGLHPGSIYCAFTNKRGLLIAALAQYRSDRQAEIDAHFAKHQDIVMALKAYLQAIVAECASGEPSKACLLHQAMNEVVQQDAEVQQVVQEHVQSWEATIADKFDVAKNEGLLTNNTSSIALARYFVLGVYGLRTYANTTPNPEVLEGLASQLLTTLGLE